MSEIENNTEWEPTSKNVYAFIKDVCDDKEVLEDEYSKDDAVKFPNGWVAQHVHREGGYEGGGDEHWIVFSLTKGDTVKYFRVPGWYASYHGSELEWSNLHEAVPVIKQYTDYVRLK